MTNFRALIIPVDLSYNVFAQRISSIHQMQEILGGNFDCIRTQLPSRQGTLTTDLWVNDEGLLLNMPVNIKASSLWMQRIVGPVIVSGGADLEGETLDCPEILIEACILSDLEMQQRHEPR